MATATNTDINKLEKKLFNRPGVEDLAKRRFFFTQSFQIYHGVAGLFDYGPTGCAVKNNLIALWRQHFVLEEDMLEVDCTAVTPEIVLTASGHVQRFNDFLVKDVVTKACFRADHILEDALEKLAADKKTSPTQREELLLVKAKAGDMSKEDLTAALRKYNVKAPETNNDITDPQAFNLMFKTSIGPSGDATGYLRPETAQGIFTNFKKLLEFNGGRLPFAAAQIGNAYRNEIAPRSGLLRVREFTMAEIEHFVKQEDKSHPKFKDIAHLKLNLLSAASQSDKCLIIEKTLGEAVQEGTINNETLGYFIGRTQQFLVAAGIKPHFLRFRQHQSNEMAHYANDCWDAEIFSSYGWIECVGHADRGCFDLTQHTAYSKQPLQFFEEFPGGPKIVKIMKATINKGEVGKQFKKEGAIITEYLVGLQSKLDEARSLQEKLSSGSTVEIDVDGKKFPITKNIVSFTDAEEKVNGTNITPNVIEPSFGLGRIIYSILEHAYYVRHGDEQRCVLGLPPVIAPVKTSVLPLTQSPELQPFVKKIVKLLKEHGISNKVDDTGSAIGRRYARTDEIGIPFGITIDFDTVKDDTVTLRERDSTKQVRVKIEELAPAIKRVLDGNSSWDELKAKFPAYEPKE